MIRSAALAAAAILASAIVSPAGAQQVVYNPGYCAQFYPNANCQNLGPGNPYRESYQRHAYRNSTWRNRTWRNSYNHYDGRGFRPADVAAGVAGGAVGTAAAVATGPAVILGGDEYARRNGFVCTPGTWFRGDDGRRHICQ
jgi:hypothetical protein